jgi:hypothetical protein
MTGYAGLGPTPLKRMIRLSENSTWSDALERLQPT